MPSSATTTARRPSRAATCELGARGGGVLRHVGERLGADEVDGGLELVGQPLGANVELDGNRSAPGQRRRARRSARPPRARGGASRVRARAGRRACGRADRAPARRARCSARSRWAGGRQGWLPPCGAAAPVPREAAASSRRRSWSPASSRRRRDALSSPARSRTSACSATLDADSRVAAVTASTSAGSRSTAASCTSTANGSPSRSTRVADRPDPSCGRASALPASSR